MGEVYFLGVDVGGSKTHALICTQDGNVIGFGEGPGGNPEEVGETGLVCSMRIAINKAESFSNSIPINYCIAGFGIAGYDWDCDREMIEHAITSLGLNCPFVVENDVIPLLWACTSRGWGIAVTAGTGNNVRGRNQFGKSGRISGNSIQNGEFGGAGELVFLAKQRLSQIWSLRSDYSVLVERFLEFTGAKNLPDLVEGLVRNRYQLKASEAPIILQAAQESDPVALEIVWFNVHELAKSVQAVARQLELEDNPFDLILAGSLLVKSDFYRELFLQIVEHILPKARPLLLNIPSVTGAVLMAMSHSVILTQIDLPSEPWRTEKILNEIQSYFNSWSNI